MFTRTKQVAPRATDLLAAGRKTVFLMSFAVVNSLATTTPARADVVTDWNTKTVGYVNTAGRPAPAWILDLAMVHAWLAQMFFCLVVALAVLTSPHWQERSVHAAPARFTTATLATALLVMVQLVVGILIRHAGQDARPLAGNWLFYVHGTGALCVLLGALRMRLVGEQEGVSGYLIARSRLLMTLTVVQIVLGVGAWLTTEAGAADRSASALESWIPTFHVALGAAVLACSVTLALHALAGRRAMAEARVPLHTAAARR